MEELIESYKLIVNNDTDFLTRPLSSGISIDLAITSLDLDPLCIWEIPEEYPSLSDHELILIEWEDIGTQGHENAQATMSGWSIKNLLGDNKLFEAALMIGKGSIGIVNYWTYSVQNWNWINRLSSFKKS